MRTEFEKVGSRIETKDGTLIRAAIFDLDGVIVDTAHYHYLAWKRMAHQLGFDLSLEDNERLKGVSRMQSLDIILEIGGTALSEVEKERLADQKNAWFLEYVEQMKPTDIFPGVKPLIEDLRRLNLKIGLASSSKNAARVLELLQIQSLFDEVVDGTMIKNSKPDPEIFLLAAQRLRLEPAQCVVFEDAEAGVEAALNAGMKCVGVGSMAQLNRADRVITRTGEFPVSEIHEL